eukprot:10919133-Ditylum_brightwellii.AAC.1
MDVLEMQRLVKDLGLVVTGGSEWALVMNWVKGVLHIYCWLGWGNLVVMEGHNNHKVVGAVLLEQMPTADQALLAVNGMFGVGAGDGVEDDT